MNFKKKLGYIVVILSIIIMVGLMLLCVHYKINPLFGIGTGFAVMITLITIIPKRWISHE